MPSILKIITAAVLFIAGLASAVIVELRDASRRPDYCASCHVTAPNLDTWVSSDYLANKHARAAISCQRCHERSVGVLVREIKSMVTHDYELPLKELQYPTNDCERCHGDYAAVARRTSRLPRNPHASPHGQLECRECHKVHKPSADACAECHDPIVAGSGWATRQ